MHSYKKNRRHKPWWVWDALLETRPQSGEYHEEIDMILFRQMWLRTGFLAQASLLYDEEWLSQQGWVLAGAMGRHWEAKPEREEKREQSIMREKEHSKPELLLCIPGWPVNARKPQRIRCLYFLMWNTEIVNPALALMKLFEKLFENMVNFKTLHKHKE